MTPQDPQKDLVVTSDRDGCLDGHVVSSRKKGWRDALAGRY